MDISAYQHMNIRMSTRGKRPLRNLTPSDKVRAIQRIHNGETKASVSRDIGVPESTLRGWCKNEQKLRFMCRQIGTADQITVMQSTENPPEKRPRFDNHIQAPKYSANASFDEFAFNRLPLNGLSFPTNDTNTIFEKIAFNEIMKKHMLAVNSSIKPPVENIASQMSSITGGLVPTAEDFNSQLSMMQNLNLLSLFSPNLSSVSNPNATDAFEVVKNEASLRIIDEAKDNSESNSTIDIDVTSPKSINSSQNSTSSLSVKNWAKDPAEKTLLRFTNQNHINNVSVTTPIKNSYTAVNNDSNNNKVNGKIRCLTSEVASDALHFPPPPLPLGQLQIPNLNNTCDSDSGNNTALLEWCKVFNASLNFLALAAAAAALQPNGSLSGAKSVKKEENILYKELTKSTSLFDSENNPASFLNSDLSSDSFLESEPEDLSVRSTVTSKL